MTQPENALARRIRQMADAWEQHLPDVIRTPAVVSALRAALESAEAAAVSAAVAPPTNRSALRDRVEVWPLARVLAEVQCGSADWSWEEEWADLDQRHADTGYLTALERQIQERGITMPVLIGSDGRLWDGHHRLRIAVRLGIPYVPVELTPPADAVLAVLPEPADRAAILADVERAIRTATGSCGYKAEDGCDFCNGVATALDQVRRMADETATETPAATTVPCSGTLGTPHQPHNWEPQPGMEPVHCPGTRKPAARCTCQYIAESWIQMDHSPDCPAAGARQDGTET